MSAGPEGVSVFGGLADEADDEKVDGAGDRGDHDAVRRDASDRGEAEADGEDAPLDRPLG